MILLISDLHLEEQRPDITRAFLRFLETRASGAEALYILGDFFEVWIGDDGMTPYQHQIAAALRALSESGTRLYLMHGNRDFMIGQAFCREAGCTLLSDPHIATLGGERVLLMHGDSLCTRDEGYMRLRRLLRNPLSLFILHHLSLARRQKLAQKLRSTSREETRMKASDIVDVTPDEVIRAMRKHKVRTLIHGHTHRPATHSLQIDGQAARRIVLGDWDRQGWALQIDESGLHQAPFDLD
ncbi:UDP-2,3-diacylglucosamine diphosphatase [Stutzerimonas nitrititolerans]|uniref:UDP-2,3-diacylglucosamine diphosphatase n=1 Tax=Stutzerimonas nitrititolerans TaxID=2482751 RepID=UPI000F794C83|nr:UDP-2,3-diacylglucosamine diphosphatase [Stutzerimonas nitrititolerans]RRV26434.1 UDP-2,3-diacylglucosamine diphosphatase [Pseudomonas sp. s199]